MDGWMGWILFAVACQFATTKEIMPTNGIMHHILLMVNAV